MSAGKGDKPRKVDGKKFREQYDRIFMKPMTPAAALIWHNDPRWYPSIDYAEVARLTGLQNRMAISTDTWTADSPMTRKQYIDQYHPDTVKLRDHSKHSKKKKK